MENEYLKWFSKPYETLEASQKALGSISFFERYGAFVSPGGKFVTANLRLQQWSKDEIKAIHDNVLELTGYRMVAYTDALFGWTEYK